MPIWKENTKKLNEGAQLYNKAKRITLQYTDIFFHMEVLNMRNQGKTYNFAGQKLEKIKIISEQIMTDIKSK